jgi:hypothetical protein
MKNLTNEKSPDNKKKERKYYDMNKTTSLVELATTSM